jgi:hypothetical protein
MSGWAHSAVAIVLASACSNADSSPDPRGPDQWEESLSAVPLTENDDRIDSFRITVDSATYRVGNPPTTDLEEFGWFSDGVLFEDGSVALPDLKHRQLLVVSPAGGVDLLAQVGEGPGEVRFPFPVFRTGPQQFDVIDNALQRRTRFHVINGVPRPMFSAPTGSQPSGGCAAGSGYLVVDFDTFTGTTFARYDSAGARLHAFGPRFYAGSRLGNGIVTRGRLVCDDPGGTILFAGALGDFLAFDSAGTVLWRRKLRDFRPHRIIDRGSTFQFGGLADSAQSATALKALLRLNERIGLLQLAVFMPGEGGANRERLELSRVESYLIELSTGREVGHQSDLPVVLSSTVTRLLLFGEEPEPWVEVRGFRVVERAP